MTIIAAMRDEVGSMDRRQPLRRVALAAAFVGAELHLPTAVAAAPSAASDRIIRVFTAFCDTLVRPMR